ncbi:cytochrome c oxidase subunit II [Novosphingobium malaysiense]|uniref:Cytochrome aa3 subunit 2 n=1 Tax=Novosphingobium malaysiense TaxID=1348853 RepID=A0A0B1ZKQ8_9SPHN|nr:cytochrome c oxidase subunit II [Novosphingobium malaysiense]KHK91111.1 cytochrome B561 [Novosphingobium malaysiense]
MRKLVGTSVILLAGCNAHQSTLAPFGEEARSTYWLTVTLGIGALLIAVLVGTLAWRAAHSPGNALDHRQGMRLILWLGAVFPTVVLTALLLFALPEMRPLPSQPGDLTIRVDGEQFWWRVQYESGRGEPLIGANEVRIPVGRPVVFQLAAKDVIHSFWIPGLAGKMDMIPGRTNRLIVKAEKTGRFRGVCAEFCGLSHALMAFDVVAMEPSAFDAWLVAARTPAAVARGRTRGAALFADYGCNACHAVRGTEHDARIGPDLSRYGARTSLGAGTLPPTTGNTATFIRDADAVKPGARMPSYPMMPEDEAHAIAAWLKELK